MLDFPGQIIAQRNVDNFRAAIRNIPADQRADVLAQALVEVQGGRQRAALLLDLAGKMIGEHA